MTPEQLLQICETLTHNGRMRYMFELGRATFADASIASTIAVLQHGDVYQRALALQSCFGSRDAAHVLRALADPSRSIRALALGLVAVICSDAEVQTALSSLPLAMQRALLRRLHRRNRQAPIDTFLETLASRQDTTLKKLLPFASSSVVIHNLQQVIDRYELPDWRRLARLHPSLAVEQLRARATSIGTSDQRLILQVNAVLSPLSRFAPDQALDLVRAIHTIVPLAQLHVPMLAKRRPDEIADLLLQSDEVNNLNMNTIARRLSTERLLALLTRYASALSSRCFRDLTPDHRLAIYMLCARGWRTDEGLLSYEIVAALPSEQRIQEGRRHLALPALATRPLARIPYAAFLPWDEARAVLDTSLRSPDADQRGITLRALISATRYQRGHLVDALTLVRQRRNEQDPVRREMLMALDGLPYGMWRAEHLNDLAQIIRDALDASDLSTPTVQALERIVLHLLPFHPAWSASQIPLIYREHGRVSVFGLDTFLSDSDTRRIAPVLLPVLQAWQEREHDWQLITMAIAFGRRLRVFDELAAILEPILDYTRTLNVADSILRLFSDHCRERLARIVPALLARDKSAIVMQPVYMYLHRYRQDLLTPFLGQHVYSGRFSTGRTRMVLALQNGFFRWTPAQQDIFARTLLDVANDQKMPTPILLNAIRRLGSMPSIDPSYIIKYASDSRQPVRDTALRVLGTLDAGQGIQPLLEMLNDDRARIAIYALRNSLLSMPQSSALRILRTVPLSRVTVAKEVVRLIGDLSSSAAFHALQEIHERELHRDVRVALLRAFWPYLERSETWAIFTSAAQSPDPALVRGVIPIPADGLSPLAQRRLATLLASVLARPEPALRVEVLERCVQNPLTDYEHTLFPGLLAALNSQLPDECTRAASALFTLYAGNDAPLVGDTIRGLLDNRRALHIAIENFLPTLFISRRRLLPTTRTILAALSQDRLTISLRLGLILLGLPWQEVAPELIRLTDSLHADALAKAQLVIQQATRRPEADLLSLEMTLAASDDERLRRLALSALLAQSRQARGWSDALIERLSLYRSDPSPLVAEAAQFTFVPQA